MGKQHSCKPCKFFHPSKPTVNSEVSWPRPWLPSHYRSPWIHWVNASTTSSSIEIWSEWPGHMCADVWGAASFVCYFLVIEWTTQTGQRKCSRVVHTYTNLTCISILSVNRIYISRRRDSKFKAQSASRDSARYIHKLLRISVSGAGHQSTDTPTHNDSILIIMMSRMISICRFYEVMPTSCYVCISVKAVQ